MKTAIAILNWNGRALLEEYLPIVLKHAEDAQVVVIDNGSTDDSLEYLKPIEEQVTVIQLEKNYGFADGYNKGIEQIDAELIVLLNSDAYPSKGWLAPIQKAFQNNSTLGAVQPKILAAREPSMFEYAGAAGGLLDTFGYPYCRGRVLSKIEEDKGQYQTNIPILWASGAALCIRKEVYLSAGELDGDLFAHMEEIDLCWRIWRSGYTIQTVMESTVFHLGGASLDKANPQKTFLNFRNNLVLIWKHWPFSWLLFKFPIRILLDYLAFAAFLLKGNTTHAFAILKAHRKFFGKLRFWNKKRRALRGLPKYTSSEVVQGSVFLK